MDAEVIKSGRVAAVQTLSGTGACRIAGEYISRFFGKGKKLYYPDPTWGNHIPIMRDAGLTPTTYKYFKPSNRSFDFEGMMADVKAAETGSAFLLHACAHNPTGNGNKNIFSIPYIYTIVSLSNSDLFSTSNHYSHNTLPKTTSVYFFSQLAFPDIFYATGCDPSKEQWNEISALFKSKGHIAFLDCAYQGFASGNSEEDAYSIRRFVADGNEILLGQSYAKVTCHVHCTLCMIVIT
jgi:aspartate/tyrosine/aromatic aminotransferase